jgi:hypothetical protein
MKGQSDGQNYFELRDGIGITKLGQQYGKIIIKKVIVFEKGQKTQIGNKACHKKPFSILACKLFQVYAGKVVNNYGERQDENVYGNERHIEVTAGK